MRDRSKHEESGKRIYGHQTMNSECRKRLHVPFSLSLSLLSRSESSSFTSVAGPRPVTQDPQLWTFFLTKSLSFSLSLSCSKVGCHGGVDDEDNDLDRCTHRSRTASVMPSQNRVPTATLRQATRRFMRALSQLFCNLVLAGWRYGA